MSRASNEALDALHGLLAGSMTDELKRAIERAKAPVMVPEDPAVPNGPQKKNPNYEPLSPKLLAVAIKFLKDNGVDAPASSKRFSPLIEELENLNVDDPTLYAN
jgi:hypothetical protein